MSQFAITLQYHRDPVRKPKAWFVPGCAPVDWWHEIGDWGIPMRQVAICPVPTSVANRTPIGALVLVGDADRPAVSARAVPYGCLAGKLYLPVEATLTPAVSEAELVHLLDAELSLLVWHPSVGLIGIEPHDRHPVTDFLSWPEPREADWTRARPGIVVNDRLRSLTPAFAPTVAQILEEGREDIGTQAANLSDLPPPPNESRLAMLAAWSGGLALATIGFSGWLVTQVARLGLSLIFSPGAGEVADGCGESRGFSTLESQGKPGWLSRWLGRVFGPLLNAVSSRLESWKDRASGAIEKGLHAKRLKEVERLLEMLATNPDEGLRYAIPFGDAAGERRGRGSPSGRLHPRDVNFNLGRLAGGGRADYWWLPPEYTYRLLQEYRRLAERELHLNRYRRAAYIFAELLGDLPAAAGALEAGRYYQEAAVLYRDKLLRPLEAARCLGLAGLWVEALALYEKLEEYEQAGDLATRFDQMETAARCYRVAIEQHLLRLDFLGAARLLETKLQVPEAALQLLQERGWGSSQHALCIDEAFRLSAELGQHATARNLLQRFVVGDVPIYPPSSGIDVIGRVAHEYPEESIRQAAHDAVIRVASHRVDQGDPAEQSNLLAVVAKLVPEDRLLDRDCRHYQEQVQRRFRELKQSLAAKCSSPLGQRTRGIELVRSIQLPSGCDWSIFRASKSYFCAAGLARHKLCVALAQWDVAGSAAPFQVQSWPLNSQEEAAALLLSLDLQELHPVHVHLSGAAPVPQQVLGTDSQHAHKLLAGSPPWATAATLAITHASYLAWTLNQSAGGLGLTAYNSNHRPVASQLIELPQHLDLVPGKSRVHLQVRFPRVYIGHQNHLLIFQEKGGQESLVLPGLIQGLAVPETQTQTQPQVAVTYEQGGQLAWGDQSEQDWEWFARDLERPSAAFLRTGQLVVAGTGGGLVYEARQPPLRLVNRGDWNWDNSAVLGVLCPPNPNEFAVAFDCGQVCIYRML
ncbi:MAG: hypothetical protein JSS02_08905 [Planctomycetes bacterium]|nr:hypothetical protein [Planctomycetota bacterium]